MTTDAHELRGHACRYGCRDCREAFPVAEVVHLAEGTFLCLACYHREKMRRTEHGLEPLKLMINPTSATDLTYTDDGIYHGRGM